MRVATIDGTRFHDAGASDAQELGYAIAVVVATLRRSPTAPRRRCAFAPIELRLAATVDQFLTIAKFRAARRLLAASPRSPTHRTPPVVPLHAVTSRAMTPVTTLP